MNERHAATRASARNGLKWIVRAALTLSLIANVGLIAKIAVFDPAFPFRPICFSKPQGLVVLDGVMRERFKQRVLRYSDYAMTLAKDGTIYISRWDWWREKESIWNMSRQVAV